MSTDGDARGAYPDLLQTILESIPIRVFWKDLDSRYLGCNPAFARDAGLARPDELIGKTDDELGWRAQAPLYRADDRAVMASGQPRLGYEEPQTTATGGTIWLRTSKVPLREPGGAVIGVLGIYEDITAQREAQDALTVTLARRDAMEVQLRASENRFRALVEQSPLATQIVAPDGRTLQVNRAWEQLWGVPFEGLANYNLLQDPQLRALGLIPDVERAFRGESVTVPVVEYDRAAEPVVASSLGGRLWVRTTLYPVRGDDGRVREIALLQEDLTEQRAQEQALLQTRRQHEEAQRIAHLGHWQLDHATGHLDWSDEAFRIFGIDRSRFGASYAAFLDAVHPDDRRCVETAFEDSVANRTGYDLEHRLIAGDGGIRWVKERCETVYDAEGRPQTSTGTVTDITDLKLAEERLRTSRDFLGKIVGHASEGIAVCHAIAEAPFVRFSVWNERMTEFTGYSLEEVNRQGWLLTLHPERSERDRARARLERIKRGESLRDEAWDLVSRRGERLTMSVSTSTITLEDGQAAFVVLMHDITGERRAREEQARLQGQLAAAQRLDSIGRLAGGVAHDFNNMLSVIMGRATVAMDHLEPSHPAIADLKEIMDAGQRSAELTRQLLAFARRQAASPVEIDLDEKVGSLIKMLRRLIGEDISLEWVPSGHLSTVRVDPSQVDQILANLCVNARDAIRGVGTIRIETSQVMRVPPDERGETPSTARPYVQLVVTDTGCGMDEEVLSHLFEPFFTTKGLGQGTGLGLATVYGIVKQNGGLLDVTSAPGEGASFRICLPAVGEHTPRKVESPEPGRSRARGDERILLVEDEPAVMRLTARFLEKLGYSVLSAGAPAAALAMMREHAGAVDLLITDVIMPEMSGWELSRRLQAEHPELAVLYMSGYTADVLAPRGVLAPGTPLLQKPFTFDELAGHVRLVLERSGR